MPRKSDVLYAQKHEAESYRLTDEYMDTQLGSWGCLDDYRRYRPEDKRLIGSGAWVMIIKDIPVANEVRPKKWNIYWATPNAFSKNLDGYDQYGRYKVDIIIKRTDGDIFETVSCFPDECAVFSDEIIQGLLDENEISVQMLHYAEQEELNLDLIQQGRDLTEDEREIIMALMLDGLSEHHACQEYFLGRHISKENRNIFYIPNGEVIPQLENTFGSRRTI